MAISATFFLDSPSLSTATAIYGDEFLTTLAPDGFYSDGTIVREQSLGVLLPQVVCPSCAEPCGGSIAASGSEGVYYINIDLGSGTGASIVSFQPYTIPDGILATYNSINYNGVSSPVYGWLQSSLGNLPTYLGSTGDDCGLVAGSPHVIDVYNYSGGSFVPSGGTESVNILAGQLDLTAGDPGVCIMVIPKTTASPSTLTLKVIGVCPSTGFAIEASCAAPLTSFASSTVGVDSAAACADAIDQTYYVAHVTGSAGNVLLYDLVYSDPNGQFKLGAGYYKTTDSASGDILQVDANGVVIAITTCPS
jgi:hypothetical protein